MTSISIVDDRERRDTEELSRNWPYAILRIDHDLWVAKDGDNVILATQRRIENQRLPASLCIFRTHKDAKRFIKEHGLRYMQINPLPPWATPPEFYLP